MFEKIKNLMRIGDLWKRVALLESKHAFLRDKVELLEAKAKEVEKKTISQKTLEEDKPLATGQIINEWLNGKEDESGT